MDYLTIARDVVKRVIREYAAYKPAYGKVDVEVILDDELGHYELSFVGWNQIRRIHGPVIHVDLKRDKVWIQHDGTEEGIAYAFVAAGIPKDRIVLAFHHPLTRAVGEFALG
jgi:hypothetical protein